MFDVLHVVSNDLGDSDIVSAHFANRLSHHGELVTVDVTDVQRGVVAVRNIGRIDERVVTLAGVVVQVIPGEFDEVLRHTNKQTRTGSTNTCRQDSTGRYV